MPCLLLQHLEARSFCASVQQNCYITLTSTFQDTASAIFNVTLDFRESFSLSLLNSYRKSLSTKHFISSVTCFIHAYVNQRVPSCLTAGGMLVTLSSSMSSCHRLESWPSSAGSSRIPGLLFPGQEQHWSATNSKDRNFKAHNLLGDSIFSFFEPF